MKMMQEVSSRTGWYHQTTVDFVQVSIIEQATEQAILDLQLVPLAPEGFQGGSPT